MLVSRFSKGRIVAVQKRLRVFWGLLLLLSIGWMFAGAFISSDAYEEGDIGQDLSAEIKTLADGINVDVSADLPLSLLFFIVTGTPVALLSLAFMWRNQRVVAASAAVNPAGNLRRQTIFITILALAFALLIWNMRDVERFIRGGDTGGINVSVITYPVRLFVTYVHEAGHSLAALLTGGQVQGFTVSADGSGLAVTAGGNPSLILPAGYLGAALFGSLLFFLANRVPRWTRALSVLLGLSIIVLTLGYAMPDQGGSPIAMIVGICSGVAMLAMGWQASRIVNLFVLNTLAILTGLNAVFDLWLLIRNPSVGSETALNDAAAFSERITPLLPAAVVAAIWAAVAIAMLAFAVYFGLLKQVGGEISAVMDGQDKVKP